MLKRLLLLTVSLVPAVVQAHNTAVAVAAPVEEIVIDGDFSDWPDGARRHAIAGQRAVSAPADSADLTAWFRVAWHEPTSSLYVAIEMQDQSHVIIDSSSAWNASDGCEVFLDIQHLEHGSATLQHTLYGVHHQVFASGADSSDQNLAAYAVRRLQGTHQYEWRFALAGISNGVDGIGAGLIVGLDVAVADRDDDGSFTWMAWGAGIGKSGNAHRLGDLLLLPAEAPGHVSGTVRWRKKEQGLPPRRVRLTPEGMTERFGLVLAVDNDGRYEADLPAGTWTAEATDLRIRRDKRVRRKVKVGTGEALEVGALKAPVEKNRSVLVDQLFADEPDRPGAAVLVARHGRIEHQRAYGLAEVELGVAITPRTKFRIASVSKQFTTTAVMMLVQQGLIDLDAPLSTYLPDYPHAQQVTTRQLMTHTSGIPNYLSMSEFWDRGAVGGDMADLLDVFQHQELDFTPGSRYSYSNSGYVVLAHLLETFSGETYDAFLQSHIFDVLGMKDSGVDHYRPLIAGRAAGYSLSAEGDLVNTSWLDMYLLTGAGNIYSTTGDLYKWDQALNAARLLPQSTLQEMFSKATLADGNEISYGLGYRIGELHGLREVGHSGSINGFTSQFSRYPDQGLTVVVLDNSPWIAPGVVARQIAEIYLANEMVWVAQD